MKTKFSPELNALINAAQNRDEIKKAAAMMFQFYTELVNAGFDKGQALYVVVQTALGGNKAND